MKTIATVILLFLFQFIHAQKAPVNEYASVDSKAFMLPDSMSHTTGDIAKYISENFKTDKEKARAAYIWVAAHIDYDVANMFALNFYEKREEKIVRSLRTRKGICENFAALFTDICNKTGIKSYVVEGYTRQNGFTDYIPHAWCAALIDGSWSLFDPTWASGYISKGKFYKKIDNSYFKIPASTLIKSHMPFDCMWQFLNYPVTNQEFYEEKTKEDKSKLFFNYADTIAIYEKLDSTDQLIASADRVERNGVRNAMIIDRLQHLKMKIESDREQHMINLYNAAVIDGNDAVNFYNEFINYRNKQFIPVKPDSVIKNMIDMSEDKLISASAKLSEIKNPGANMTPVMAQLSKLIDDTSVHVKEQQDWLKTYFSKGKLGRKSMFYSKITWMGIPLKK